MDSSSHELANPQASSIEDVLAGALWVTNLTDPSLSLTSLHETFMEIIFRFVAQPEAVGESMDQQRLRTAAERERDRRFQENLRREMQELQAGTISEARQSSVATEDDEDDDGVEEAGHMAEEDRQFLAWIYGEHKPKPDVAERVERVKAIELELGRVGLGEEQEAVAEDVLPERFKYIEMRDKRPCLGSKRLPGGYTYNLPLEHEAYWILRQLRGAGQPLAHNTRICALANRSQVEIADEPVVVAIAYALRAMTREYIEPATLMIYHQTALHPLLNALLEDSALTKAAEYTLPLASYAYSTQTGRRQRPYISEHYVGFGVIGDRSIGEGDPQWQRLQGTDLTQRKPCFIELGRLLVRILELDSLCHKLEYHRQQMLMSLKDNPEARVQDQRSLLEGVVFESVMEADLWHTFTQFLTSETVRGATQRVRVLGLDDAFEEYSITGLQYQENHLANAPVNLCPTHRTTLHEWAEQVGGTLRPPQSAEAVVALFNSAIVEQFSKLPIIRKQIVDLFCAEGELIVTYNWIKRRDDVYPLASFFVEHPRHYLDLLLLERQGTVNLYYVLDDDLVRRTLSINRLYQRPNANDDWCRERESAMELLIVRLVDGLIPKVRMELSQQAHYHVQMEAVQRLGVLCSQGPYQATRLCLDGFTGESLTWESEWNIVEALPCDDAHAPHRKSCSFIRPQARVCAAYLGETGVTTFCCIDENGNVTGSVRWSDCAMNSATGREAALLQSIQLEKLFRKCTPAVVAIGASGSGILDLVASVQRFLNERIRPSLRVDIPVVWASPEVARFYTTTHYADMETPSADSYTRTSIALARYVQDPLNAICTLFDSKHTALQLCNNCGGTSTSEQEEQLYTRLSWEMSLWVSATGFWIDGCIQRPNSIAVLQFVAGLGLSKARRFHQHVNETPPRSSAETKDRLMDLFGRYVTLNAVNLIRVDVPDTPGETGGHVWHVLDQTLIPMEWYTIAAYAAGIALHGGGQPPLTALLEFVEKSENEKRRLIDKHANQQDLIVKVRELWQDFPGERELELILEELVALGRSSMRRPYRRLSKRELMTSITGMIYLTKVEASSLQQGQPTAHSDSLASNVMVREGDYITGTVSGVIGGMTPGIRITTSRGLSAFIAAVDISNEALRVELLEYVRHSEGVKAARKNGLPVPDVPHPAPEWLRRGALLQGTVHRCNWARCELILNWCRPRDIEPEGNSTTDGNIPSYAMIVKDAASSVNSLKTVELARDAVVFSTKICRHTLFRDISNTQASELLRDKEIGEVILRPASGRRHKAVCVVKVGHNSICNWIISESRRSSGNIYYILVDKTVEQTHEFDEVDELLQNYMAPMVALVKTIRQHRRFEDSVRDVPSALRGQQKHGSNFAYAFAETGQGSRPPSYRVFTRGGEHEYGFRLHITNKYIYVRLPFTVRIASGQSVVFKWVKCRNAEHVSESVKKHAIQSK